MTNEPRFDVFSGEPDRDAMWCECCEGLANARERMEQLAAQFPGKYFIFSSSSHAILATIDTTRNFLRAGELSKKKASA